MLSVNIKPIQAISINKQVVSAQQYGFPVSKRLFLGQGQSCLNQNNPRTVFHPVMALKSLLLKAFDINFEKMNFMSIGYVQ